MKRGAAFLLCVVALAAGCSKSDAQRAAEERAKIAKQIEKSMTLVPYRGLKTMLRSHTTAPPAELVELRALFDKSLEPPADGKEAAALYLKIAYGVYRSRDVLKQHDEDKLPTLWVNYAQAPLPAAWYDGPIEHLAVGVALEVLALADRSGKAPLPDLVFYELSRAEVQSAWPSLARAAGHLARGAAFAEADFHYAAEEELGLYLADWEKVPPVEIAFLAGTIHCKPEDVVESGRAAGHFVRAWNRMDLGRDKGADEDIEAALTSLQKVGIDNEVTQWGWAFLNFRRGKYPEAGQSLEKLASSPHLDEATRKEIKASADELRASGKKIPIFSKARAARLLVVALLARAGGLEKIFVALVGDEHGKRIYRPLAWLDHVKDQNPTDAISLDKAKDETKALGGKGVDFLKSHLPSKN